MNDIFRKQANRLFIIYIASGIAYLSLLFILSTKALPGFFMQLLFLGDALINNPDSLNTLIQTDTFIQSTFLGVLALMLLSIALKGILTAIQQVIKSQKFVNGLKGKFEGTINYLTTRDTTVFTAGLLAPKVYISETLAQSLSPQQLKAVLLHETSHCTDYDPLRGVLVQLVNNIILPFPFKNDLHSMYTTAVELKSDEYAEEILGNKKPIVEALYSILSNRFKATSQLNVSYFSNIPERIPVLVGAKKFNFRLVTTLSSLFLFVLTTLPVIAYTIKYYNCAHIENCVQIFVSNLKNNASENLCSAHFMDASHTCPVR